MSSSGEPFGLQLTRRSWLRLAGTALVAASHAAPAHAELRSLRPEDQSERDASLQALLGTIRAIVRRRDARALLALMAPDFKVEFDVGKGPTVFQRHWRPETPGSRVWLLLDRMLSLGGTFYSDSLFALPYVYTRFPHDLDRLDFVVATGEIPMRAAANATGAQVGVMKDAIVQLAAPLTPPALLADVPFVAVRHPEHGVCYVAGSAVYSPAGHRAFFEKRQGQWRWLSLAAPTLATPPVLLTPPGATP
jgi:hypothetical protein